MLASIVRSGFLAAALALAFGNAIVPQARADASVVEPSMVSDQDVSDAYDWTGTWDTRWRDGGPGSNFTRTATKSKAAMRP